jgi:hypothetical protein
MKLKISRGGIAALVLTTLLLSACAAATPTEDPAVKITQIAATIQAEFTQNAALTPSATPTSEPTATPTMEPPTPTIAVTDAAPTATVRVDPQGSVDDKAVYVSDVTIPDGTIVKPGSTVVKVWAIKNIGTTTWKTSYRLAYLEGVKDAKEMLYVYLPNEVKPGTSVQVTVTFTAPASEGKYSSYWRLVNSDGQLFGEELSMKIVAGNP